MSVLLDLEKKLLNSATPKEICEILNSIIKEKRNSMGRKFNQDRFNLYLENLYDKLHPSIQNKNKIKKIFLALKNEKPETPEYPDSIKDFVDLLMSNSEKCLEFFTPEVPYALMEHGGQLSEFRVEQRERKTMYQLLGDSQGVDNWIHVLDSVLLSKGIATSHEQCRRICKSLRTGLRRVEGETEYTRRRIYHKGSDFKDVPWTTFETPEIPEYKKTLYIGAWKALEFGMVNVSTWRSMIALAHLDKFSGKQTMILEGPTNTGKGVMLRALHETIFGEALTAHKEDFSGESFGKEALLNKKYNLIYDTTKESILLSSDFLKVIGGEDNQEVNRKNKSYVNVKFHIFSIMATNLKLWMNNTHQLKTRIVRVLIDLKKDNQGKYIRGEVIQGDVPTLLREQLPAYIAHCIHALSKRQVKENGSLVLDKVDEELQQDLIDNFLSPVIDFVIKNTEITCNSEDFAPDSLLKELYRKSPEFTAGRQDYIIQGILDRYPQLERSKNGRGIYGIRGLKINALSEDT